MSRTSGLAALLVFHVALFTCACLAIVQNVSAEPPLVPNRGAAKPQSGQGNESKPPAEPWVSGHTAAENTAFALVAPAAVIGVSSLVNHGSGRWLGLHERAWAPTAAAYWTLQAGAIAWWGSWSEVKHWASAPKGSGLWYAADFAVGALPTPILLTNRHLLKEHPDVTLAHFTFATLNPFFEEGFWRGLLLDHTQHWPMWARVLYSTALFAASHPLIWGIHSRANRTVEVMAATFAMGAVWSLSYEYQDSLLAVVPAHFLADVTNLAVFGFLNIYDPGSAF